MEDTVRALGLEGKGAMMGTENRHPKSDSGESSGTWCVCVCVVCVLEVGVVDGSDPIQKRENVVPDSHSGSKPRILKLEDNREESKVLCV